MSQASQPSAVISARLMGRNGAALVELATLCEPWRDQDIRGFSAVARAVMRLTDKTAAPQIQPGISASSFETRAFLEPFATACLGMRAPQDEVSNPHGEQHCEAVRLRTMLRIAGRTMRPSLGLPRHMRGQRMIGGLVEEGGLLGGRFQKLLVLSVDIITELDGLVAGHPRGQLDPGDRNLLWQGDLLVHAGGNRCIDG